VQRSGAKNLALEFSAEKQRGEMLRPPRRTQHDSLMTDPSAIQIVLLLAEIAPAHRFRVSCGRGLPSSFSMALRTAGVSATGLPAL